MQYCESTSQTKRWKTREIKVGNIGIGGSNPIRIQSMTTSSTRDIQGTVEQIIRLAHAGCEIVRVAVQGKKEAEACEGIKNTLIQKGYHIPLVADIHFYPAAAMHVVEFVDKLRINPGNFVDRRATFQKIEYDDQSYAAELVKIEQTFAPLVDKCIKLKRPLRIGTNHGSLSDRIMNRYGDTPQGMVESALEFANICRKMGYHDFIFSMKASNPLVMIQAYRFLMVKMIKLGWNYPLHLGVTEAGDGEDGRVKSSIGIGSLLLDGLGDTIRVSLTEDPWYEIDVCKKLIKLSEKSQQKKMVPFIETNRNISEIKRRCVRKSSFLHPDGTVILPEVFKGSKCDKFFNGTKIASDEETVPVVSIDELEDTNVGVYIKDGNPSIWSKLIKKKASFILLELTHSILHQGRYFFDWIQQVNVNLPVILIGNYNGYEKDVVVEASAELGSLLSDGYGEGLLLKTEFNGSSLSFNILQGCRMRASKTEFIACPSCGRTLFNLQKVTQRIRAKTSHLPGLKIAIMGCIVNGPGEMADADFGYVGSGKDKIDLYVGKTCIEKGINFSEGENRLIDLIKKHGCWVEPQ